jgi:hypothetical protein
MWHVDIDVVDLDALRHNLPSNMLIEVLHHPGPCGHPEVRLYSRFRSLLGVFLVQHGYDLDAHEIAED